MKRADKQLSRRLRLVVESEKIIGRAVGVIVLKYKKHELMAAQRAVKRGDAIVLWEGKELMELHPNQKGPDDGAA